MFGSSSNKPVCQFFLKGTCKYGTGCWNLHPQGQMGTSGGNVFGAGSSGSNSLFGGNKPNTGQETKELGDFIKQVSGEMNQWERSGQWLLSSFSPIKTSPPIAGFVDTSPEELRMEAYQANKNNTFATYQSQWNELQNKHKQIREALKMSTPEAKEALKAVYNTKSSDGAQSNPSNVFGGASGTTSTPSVFGGSAGASGTSSTSVFGAAKPQSPAVFGGAAAFGTTGSNSVFGQQKPSTFGSFGASNSSLFNKTPGTPSSTANSIFGSGANTGQNSTFATTPNTSTPNPFGGQSQGGLFGNASANKGNVFGGSAQTASVFGKPAQPTGTFGGNQNTSTLFGETKPTQSVFGASGNAFGTPSSNPATSITPSLFGSSGNSAFGAATTQSTTPSIFGAGNGGQQPSASVFGGGAATASTSVFGGAGPTNQSSSATPGSVFGATVPGSAAVPTTPASIFGAAAAGTAQAPGSTAPGSVFGGGAAATPQATAPSVFGGGAANTGVFGSAATGNSTAATVDELSMGMPSVFGNSGAAAPQPQTTQAANPFGNAGSVISSSADTNKGDGTDIWYTPVDKLSAEDLSEFQAESFTRVPLMPPPRNLCCSAG